MAVCVPIVVFFAPMGSLIASHFQFVNNLPPSWHLGAILVNMEISVILGHEKTKIRNIIDYGKIDVFSVRTNIHIKNKMMGHLI